MRDNNFVNDTISAMKDLVDLLEKPKLISEKSYDLLKRIREMSSEDIQNLSEKELELYRGFFKNLQSLASDGELASEFNKFSYKFKDEGNMSEEKEAVVTKLRQVEELEKMEAETVEEEVKEVKKISKQELDQILESQKMVKEKSELFERAATAARMAELELENAQSKNLNVIQGTFLRNGISPDMQIDNETGEVLTQEEGEARRVAKENAAKGGK